MRRGGIGKFLPDKLSRLFRRGGGGGGGASGMPRPTAGKDAEGGRSDKDNRVNRGGAGIWLIVGLGNPGGAYEATRHNVGFRAVDRIASEAGIAVAKARLGSLVGEGRFENNKLVLVKPQTFMNLSGDAVQKALRYYKADPDHMTVIYDDVDITLGKIRLRAFGGPGSHNGMRSIADHLGEGAKFPRIRIGIGPQPNNMELRDFVLKKFTAGEAELADKAVADAAAAALGIVRLGVEQAMNEHNPRRQPDA